METDKDRVGLLTKHMREFGLSGNALLPADNVLVTAVAILDKFPDSQFGQIFYWLLQALRFGRYSGSSNTALDEDLKEIATASALQAALAGMLGRVDGIG